MSNYWKKPGQHDEELDFIDNRIVIKSYYSDLPLREETYIYKGQIIPDRMIKEKEAYEIVKIDPLWVLQGFSVTVENDKVKYVSLFGFHPNKDWKTGLYCLPKRKMNMEFTPVYFDMLLRNIKTFYLDNCHVTPRSHHVIYKKIQSMYIRLSEGENDD